MSAVDTDTLIDSVVSGGPAKAGTATTASKAKTPKKAPLADPETGQTPVVPDPPRDETERLEPVPTGPVELSSGLMVDIVPLKLRETMKLLKIVTQGGSSFLENIIGDLDLEDPEAFAQTLGAMIIMSIPEAENAVVEFMQSMVMPVGFKDMTRDQKIASLEALAVEMDNPDLEDTITIVERIVRRESEDIRKLGKRISVAFQMGRKVGELPAAN